MVVAKWEPTSARVIAAVIFLARFWSNQKWTQIHVNKHIFSFWISLCAGKRRVAPPKITANFTR
jgi:hypothetical protein